MINDNRPRTTSAALSRSTVLRAASPPSPAPKASRPLFEIDGLQHGLVPIADDVRLHYVVARARESRFCLSLGGPRVGTLGGS
jgi:hypothetical protein